MNKRRQNFSAINFPFFRLFKASRIVYTAFKLLDRQLYGFCNFANKVSKI